MYNKGSNREKKILHKLGWVLLTAMMTTGLKGQDCEIERCKVCNIGSTGCVECDFGYFFFEESCVSCLDNCERCSNLDTCNQCFEGYSMNLEGSVCEEDRAVRIFVIVMSVVIVLSIVAMFVAIWIIGKPKEMLGKREKMIKREPHELQVRIEGTISKLSFGRERSLNKISPLVRERNISFVSTIPKNIEILGKSFIKGPGEEVKANVLKGVSIIGVFFGVGYDKKCKRFSTKLINFYMNVNSLRNSVKFKVVLVSLDSSRSDFNDLKLSTPYLAIPFGSDHGTITIEELNTEETFPKLVLLRGDDGSILRTNGVEDIENLTAKECWELWMQKKTRAESQERATADQTETNSAEQNPQKKTKNLIFLGRKFISKNGPVGIDTIKRFQIIAIYISAFECQKSREFLKGLKRFYSKIKGSNLSSSFEIIFASCDQNTQDFKNDAKSMPWPVIPFWSKALQRTLAEFQWEQTPSLLIISNNGTLIEKDGVGQIRSCTAPTKLVSSWIRVFIT